MLYADDMDENIISEAKIQEAMDQVYVSQLCDIDLTISTKRTEAVHQPAPGKSYSESLLRMDKNRSCS